METTKHMQAVVFDGPYKVLVTQKPVPKLEDPRDVIVKVQATALCGSELHVYRGLEQIKERGYIMGHEFVGEVIETGTAVSSVNVGDKIVVPFTVSCGECFYCQKGLTSRCVDCLLFGSPKLDGGQAEYVRVPMADSTAFKAPATISNQALIFMADIFPTGYYGVECALQLCQGVEIQDSTMVIIGCGPVGLCAIASALHFRPRHIFAIDSVEDRLSMAKTLGAEPLNFAQHPTHMVDRILEATSGRGADMVVEVVGLSLALKTAYDLVRPFGVISSIGVHNGEIPWSGGDAYKKNLRVQMGRCPVRSVFPRALAVLEKQQHLLEPIVDTVLPLSEALDGYARFEKREVQKVVFKP